MRLACARDTIGEDRDIESGEEMLYCWGDLGIEHFLLRRFGAVYATKGEGVVFGGILGIGDLDEGRGCGRGGAGWGDDDIFGKFVGLGGTNSGDDADGHLESCDYKECRSNVANGTDLS